ncbi:hypothetical protein LPU83_pLPU83a_0095 (plasmid) [Rhizobium favelukesii]|uniref:Uncharacterized protein n=1 Tax=Rhizobium favelukesii TaxID=348824 RepID=W6S0E5_9HYPH|nr:hypothetical protein LPU83_pLPU83a_0095 [Rhizobium favelukesii]
MSWMSACIAANRSFFCCVAIFFRPVCSIFEIAGQNLLWLNRLLLGETAAQTEDVVFDYRR